MTRKPSIFQAGPVANDMQQPKLRISSCSEQWLYRLLIGSFI